LEYADDNTGENDMTRVTLALTGWLLVGYQTGQIGTPYATEQDCAIAAQYYAPMRQRTVCVPDADEIRSWKETRK
jgi:hypothetical protein